MLGIGIDSEKHGETFMGIIESLMAPKMAQVHYNEMKGYLGIIRGLTLYPFAMVDDRHHQDWNTALGTLNTKKKTKQKAVDPLPQDFDFENLQLVNAKSALHNLKALDVFHNQIKKLDGCCKKLEELKKKTGVKNLPIDKSLAHPLICIEMQLHTFLSQPFPSYEIDQKSFFTHELHELEQIKFRLRRLSGDSSLS